MRRLICSAMFCVCCAQLRLARNGVIFMAEVMVARLSQPERALLHALCFCAVSRLYDDRMDLLIEFMRTALAKIARRPPTAKMWDAAASVCQAHARRNHPVGTGDWALACMKADAAAGDFHWAAFCALSEG